MEHSIAKVVSHFIEILVPDIETNAIGIYFMIAGFPTSTIVDYLPTQQIPNLIPNLFLEYNPVFGLGICKSEAAVRSYKLL